MASLFGATPQEVLYNQFKEDEKMRMLRNQQISQEGSQFGVFAPLYQASRKFGEMGSQAVTGALFPEMVNPELAKAQKVQEVLGKYGGEALTDPESLKRLGGDFISIGATEEGLKALSLSNQLAKEDKLYTVDGALVTREGKVVYQSPDKKQNIKVTPELLKMIAPADRKRVIEAGNTGQPIPADVNFVDLKENTTEFERMLETIKDPALKRSLQLSWVKKQAGQTMPPGIFSLLDKSIDNYNGLIGTSADVSEVINTLESGKLKLSPTDNFTNAFKTAAGKSDEASRAFTKFKSTLETLRNQSLRLNTGVQTEGDAVRALNEFLANYSSFDTKTALQQFKTVQQKFKIAENSLKNRIVTTGSQYGQDYTPFLGSSAGAKTYSEDQLKSGFERAKAADPNWEKLGYEEYKKRILGQ
jgi:hypothetical protein